MPRTTDAAVSTFYAAAARDCACGCGGGCAHKFDDGKVYDAALKALSKTDKKPDKAKKK